MKREHKIFLAIILDLVLITVLNCIYGFLIGGNPYLTNIPYICFLIVLTVFVTAITSAVVFGKDFYKSFRAKRTAVWVAFAILIFSFFSYVLLNKMGAQNDSIEYEAKVTNYTYVFKSPYQEFNFIDNNGNEQYVRYYEPLTVYDDEFVLGTEDVNFLYIRETKGGFKNYTIYKVIGFKE